MATTKTKTTGSKKGAAAGSKSTGSKAKGSSSSSSRSAGPKNKAASAKGAGSKKTNSGGTLRTASKQASSTKSKQAKTASSTAAKTSSRSNGASSKKATTSTKATSRSRTGGEKKSTDGLIAKAVKAVGSMLSGGAPDAIDLLKKDHRKVEDLFSKAKANEDGNNAPVFKKIKAELDVHAHIEEKVFYPFILERGDQELNRIVREGIEEHTQIKMFLEGLAGLSGTTEKFRAKLTVLIEDVEHHVKEEEEDMFPMVRDQIDEASLQKLAQRLEKEKIAFTKRSASGKKVPPAKQRAAASG